MASTKYQLESFFKDLEKQLKERDTDDNIDSSYKEFESNFEECFIVIDLTKSEIVHNGGTKKMFGYNDDYMDLAFVFDRYHPEDSQLVQLIVKNILSRVVDIKIPTYANIFSLTSRFKKLNGEYMRILADSYVIRTNKQGLVHSILVKYTDLSFLDESNTVDWKVNANFLDKTVISQDIYGEKKDIFTEREKEIIRFILNGFTNTKISNQLNISKHTVATHRKNIFSKSKCSDPEMLKIFCKKNGIFNGSKI